LPRLLVTGLAACAVGGTWSQDGPADGRGAVDPRQAADESRPPNADSLVHYVGDFDEISGSGPDAGLTRAKDGNFYGTTGYGGANGTGTVYRLTPGGQLIDLDSFPAGMGRVSYPLRQSFIDGALWGTTETGGANNCGEIFRVTLADGTFSDMHDFECHRKGAFPWGGLTLDHKGRDLYGTTYSGGRGNAGTVYLISPLNAHYEVVAHLDSSTGTHPQGDLLLGTDHCLYGTTTAGGAYDLGTIFRVCKRGKEHPLEVLHDFAVGEGHSAHGSLAYDETGKMIGTMADSIFTFDPVTQVFRWAKTQTETSPVVEGADGALYAVASAPQRPGQGVVVSFDSQLLEHHVGVLRGYAPLTSPLMRAPKGGLWGVLPTSRGAERGRAFKVTGY
jgi:uncharacterized repeat protein (TIGR03803 family)